MIRLSRSTLALLGGGVAVLGAAAVAVPMLISDRPVAANETVAAQKPAPASSKDLYEQGRKALSDPDPETAAKGVQLLTQAGEAGNAEAWFALGEAYAAGRGVAKDETAAVVAYRKGSDLGSTKSAIAMGFLLGKGGDAVLDQALSIEVLEAAIKSDRQPAVLKFLGDLHARKNDSVSLAKARTYYAEASSADSPWAQIALADMMRTGKGGDKDLAAAVDLLEKASASGNARAARALGDIYRDGKGTFHAPAKAVGYYREAAKLGDVPAMLALGMMIGRGTGVKQDIAGAIDQLEAAAAQGEMRGLKMLGDLYRSRSPRRDIDKAIESYRSAADSGDSWGYMALGDLYATGGAGKKDAEAARTAYLAAAEMGNSRARFRMAEMGIDESPSIQPLKSQASASYEAGLSSLRTSNAEEVSIDDVIEGEAGDPPPSGETTASFTSESDDRELVATVQRLLTERGYKVGAVDGKLGKKTAQAAVDLCRAEAIADCEADGVLLEGGLGALVSNLESN